FFSSIMVMILTVPLGTAYTDHLTRPQKTTKRTRRERQRRTQTGTTTTRPTPPVPEPPVVPTDLDVVARFGEIEQW
ncbi:hypothetical protein ACTHPR_10950, partial [Micrococcus luteus]|uniref:hypothetical protein n=1 Tax=Micrococcus luteus TaxID=1270 RepID=UPI003F7F56CC